jgi:hypothetical protein
MVSTGNGTGSTEFTLRFYYLFILLSWKFGRKLRLTRYNFLFATVTRFPLNYKFLETIIQFYTKYI